MMSDSKIVYWYRRNGSMVRERYRMVSECCNIDLLIK